MSTITVSGNQISFNGKIYRCAVGKAGFSADKREGDNCTPVGTFALRECWVRADRIPAPETALPVKVIQPDDGWCDDPRSTEYNRHVKILPLPLAGEGRGGGIVGISVKPPSLALPPSGRGDYSYERLWREDHVYDLIAPLGYNDDPVIPGKGSAIFLHVARPQYEGTEGCVALALPDLLEVLANCGPDTVMEIKM